MSKAEPLGTPLSGNSSLRSQSYILKFKRLHSISDYLLSVPPPHLSIASLFKYTRLLSFKGLFWTSTLKKGSKVSPQHDLLPSFPHHSLYLRNTYLQPAALAYRFLFRVRPCLIHLLLLQRVFLFSQSHFTQTIVLVRSLQWNI